MKTIFAIVSIVLFLSIIGNIYQAIALELKMMHKNEILDDYERINASLLHTINSSRCKVDKNTVVKKLEDLLQATHIESNNKITIDNMFFRISKTGIIDTIGFSF